MTLKLLEIIPVSDIKKYPSLRDKYLLQLLERQNHKCVYCSATVFEIMIYYDTKAKTLLRVPLAINSDGEEVRMTIDHIQPIAKGGNNSLKNKQAVCSKCNQKKADKEHFSTTHKDMLEKKRTAK